MESDGQVCMCVGITCSDMTMADSVVQSVIDFNREGGYGDVFSAVKTYSTARDSKSLSVYGVDIFQEGDLTCLSYVHALGDLVKFVYRRTGMHLTGYVVALNVYMSLILGDIEGDSVIITDISWILGIPGTGINDLKKLADSNGVAEHTPEFIKEYTDACGIKVDHP